MWCAFVSDNMASKPVTGHLSEDTHRQFEQFCNDRELSKSQGVERLIRRGLLEDGRFRPLPTRVRGALETGGVLSLAMALAAVVAGLGGYVAGILTGSGLGIEWVMTLIIFGGMFTVVAMAFGILIMLDVPDRLPSGVTG